MNNYETIFIIKPNLEEEAIKGLIEKFSNLINTDVKVTEVNEWGKRKLAYPMKKQTEGYYVLVNFESNPANITELERNYRITDEVIKFIVVKKD